MCRHQPGYKCVARKLAEMKAGLTWGRNISNGCQRGRTSSWGSLQVAGTDGWKFSTLTPRQLLKWLALFKLRSQNHLPITWNGGSCIFKERRHKSQGQWFLLKGDIYLSFQGDLASVHHSRVNLIRYSTQTVPFTFAAKDFPLHSALFKGGIGG